MYQPQKQGRVGRGMPRTERKRQLVSALIEMRNVAPNSTTWWNTGELARLVGLKNTANFRGILEEMYQDGDLLQQTAPHRPNQFKWIWSLSSNAPFSPLYRDICVLGD